MFDIGFWELVILFGLGLIILGPERLPKVAMQIGNWAGQARRMARTLTAQMRDELDLNRPYTPPQTYNRPGMDDLKPGASSADEENSIHPDADEFESGEPDDRDHSDAGAEADDEVGDADRPAT